MKVLVIGGGISGLTLLHRLSELKKNSGADFDVSLLEAGENSGGTIETESHEGFILEKGADSFITDKPAALELSKKLGLENELIPASSENRGSFVSKAGRLLPVPGGFYLVAPLDTGAFLHSAIFSWAGKFRMMAEPLIAKTPSDADESVASFVRRRFGREALDRVGQAMIAGIYTGDPEKLSLRAALPRFAQFEREHGSVTRGLLKEARRKESGFAAARGPRYSLFMSYRKGMQTLTDALSAAVPRESLRRKSCVKNLVYEPSNRKWKIFLESGAVETADHVCLALPAKNASLLLKQSAPAVSEELSRFQYESVATVNLAYDRNQIRHPLNGFGFVVPKTENKIVLACSFSSQKFVNRAPAGKALLRVFIGGAFGRHHFEKSDSDILEETGKELDAYLGIQGKPLFSRLKRYPKTMIQYEIGHLDRVRQIRLSLQLFPGLSLAGSSYGGVGIPDCIREAENEAQNIFESIQKESKK